MKGFQEEFGGTIADIGHRRTKWKTGYALIWTNAAAEDLLRRLAPLLRVKSRQAEALLAFADHKDGYPRPRDDQGRLLHFPAEELEARETFFWSLRSLNARGPGLEVSEAALQLAKTFRGTTQREISPRYLAGFMDGEGALMIARSFSGRYLSHSYRARIAVTNTNRQIISDIHRDFGGILIDQPSRDAHWKDGYGVVWTDGRIEPLLSSIGPELKLKDRQAKILLQFIEHKRSTVQEQEGGAKRFSRLPEEIIDIREAFYQEIRRLNARGPPRAGLPIVEHPGLGIPEPSAGSILPDSKHRPVVPGTISAPCIGSPTPAHLH